MKILTWFAASVLALSFLPVPDAGPILVPLKVVRIFAGDTSAQIYIEFNAGEMLRCFADSGGRWYITDAICDQICGRTLMRMVIAGVADNVISENQGGNWSSWPINGLHWRS